MSGLRLNHFFATTPPVSAKSQGAAPKPGDSPAADGCGPEVSSQTQPSMSVSQPRPPVVVLTGGPCGGKTILLDALMEPGALRDVRALSVPEIATTAMQGGASFGCENTDERCRRFEGRMMRWQLAAEDTMLENAEAQPTRTVLICDRGAMDTAAYCKPSVWEHVLADRALTQEQLLARYDFVLHVTSIAVDKPELYHRRNNPARPENSEDAAALDARLATAWFEHKNRSVLVNADTDFKTKIAEGTRRVADFVNTYYTRQAACEEPPRRLAS